MLFLTFLTLSSPYASAIHEVCTAQWESYECRPSLKNIFSLRLNSARVMPVMTAAHVILCKIKIGIVGGVKINWVHSALRPLIGVMCPSRVIMMEKLVEWLAGKTEVLGENLPQSRLVHHRPPHAARTRTRAVAVVILSKCLSCQIEWRHQQQENCCLLYNIVLS
jgi:hypothetical protein